MSKTLETCTPGEWMIRKGAFSPMIISRDGHCLAPILGARLNIGPNLAATEVASNARLFEQSKRMYQFILNFRRAPIRELVTTNELIMEALEIIDSVEAAEYGYERT